MKIKRPVRSQIGFTFVEVMVVIAIVSLIITILIPVLCKTQKKHSEETKEYTELQFNIGDNVYNEALGITGVVNQVFWPSDAVEVVYKNTNTITKIGLNKGLLTKLPISSDKWR